MNERQLIIDANKKKAELRMVSNAVLRINAKKLAARREIEDKLVQKKLEASLALDC